jgi:hypothetical protein
MSAKRKPIEPPETDLNTPEAVARFRKSAAAFVKEATRSRASALKVLVEIGVYNKSGKLKKRYRS